MHQIDNINQITNAWIAEQNALLNRKIARRQAYIANLRVRQPVRNVAEMII